jgi:hypothetical protein
MSWAFKSTFSKVARLTSAPSFDVSPCYLFCGTDGLQSRWTNDVRKALHLGRNSQEQLLLGQKRVFGLPYLHARGGLIRANPLCGGPQ